MRARRWSAAFLSGVALALACPDRAAAQAWLPPKGEASLTLGFLRSSAGYHLDYLGNRVSPGKMEWNNIVGDLSYGVTDRLAVRMNLPFVVSRYGGSFPHVAIPGREFLDDGGWHSAFQDLKAEVRFKATRGALAVTPMLALALPSHSYEFLGHSAPGRDLVEGQFGVSAGRLLNPVLPDAYIQARYVFAVPEKVLGISHNRSSLFVDMGYLVTPSLTVSALGAWAKTHGGWRAGIDVPPPTSPLFQFHDQLVRSEYLRLGGGLSYSINGSVDVGVNWLGTVSARSDVGMAGLTFGVSYNFSPAQILKKKKGPKTTP